MSALLQEPELTEANSILTPSDRQIAYEIAEALIQDLLIAEQPSASVVEIAACLLASQVRLLQSPASEFDTHCLPKLFEFVAIRAQDIAGAKP